MTASQLPPSGAFVSQMRSPQMTGDDQALPSMGVFHAMFLLSLQVTGRFLASEIP